MRSFASVSSIAFDALELGANVCTGSACTCQQVARNRRDHLLHTHLVCGKYDALR